ncbi:hypothetical protein [Methylocapsa palsarum]|uniref:Transposase n=1 Tax=Methylocapsa palsarum TaxID=1612308 RepID=A0A1I3ZL91_9HYPH|nr:hypothetical protein [Methylocapsa palsarum]SFK44710.1 hypothetical protein SAMN05444581_10832 [Methylocapsa palsarum]
MRSRCTGEGRERARARGVKMGREPKLTPHQQCEAVQRRLVRAAELPSMSALEGALGDARGRVREVFNGVLCRRD